MINTKLRYADDTALTSDAKESFSILITTVNDYIEKEKIIACEYKRLLK